MKNSAGVAVVLEEKVPLKAEVPQIEIKRTEDTGNNGLPPMDNCEASALTNVHPIHYKMTVTDTEVKMTDDSALKESKPSPVECISFSLLDLEQSSNSLTELPLVIDQQPTNIQNPNTSVPSVEIQVQPKEDGEYQITTPENKVSVDGVKTIKRQTSKGWF